MIWKILTLGAVPAAIDFKICHVLFALLLVAIVRQAMRVAGSALANALSGLVVISPLLWDTESMGLADLPLALFVCSALAVILELRLSERSGAGASLGLGLLIGLLPWIKLREGLTVAILAMIVTVVLKDRNRSISRWIVIPSILSAGTAIAVGRFLLPPGERFLSGNWRARAVSRLAHPLPIVSDLTRELLQPEWFGFWLIFAAFFAAALIRRGRVPLILCGIVILQLCFYGSTYFLTYLDPKEHIASSFYRISAALVPMAAVAVASFFAPARSFEVADR